MSSVFGVLTGTQVVEGETLTIHMVDLVVLTFSLPIGYRLCFL